jgi:hypothetical protein
MSKEQWGRASWYLFHTLACKLKPERADLIKPLLNVILNVCTNLPCQDCSAHAAKLLTSLNKETINTKRDLEIMLWMFHNKVNDKLGTQQILIEECDELYSRAILVPVVNHFMLVMNQRIGGERAMLYSMSRRNAINAIHKLIVENADAFMN